MTTYRGQEDLDPLIAILVANNKLEASGDPELDLLQLEAHGILLINASGAVAVERTRQQELINA